MDILSNGPQVKWDASVRVTNKPVRGATVQLVYLERPPLHRAYDHGGRLGTTTSDSADCGCSMTRLETASACDFLPWVRHEGIATVGAESRGHRRFLLAPAAHHHTLGLGGRGRRTARLSLARRAASRKS